MLKSDTTGDASIPLPVTKLFITIFEKDHLAPFHLHGNHSITPLNHFGFAFLNDHGFPRAMCSNPPVLLWILLLLLVRRFLFALTRKAPSLRRFVKKHFSSFAGTAGNTSNIIAFALQRHFVHTLANAKLPSVWMACSNWNARRHNSRRLNGC